MLHETLGKRFSELLDRKKPWCGSIIPWKLKLTIFLSFVFTKTIGLVRVYYEPLPGYFSF